VVLLVLFDFQKENWSFRRRSAFYKNKQFFRGKRCTYLTKGVYVQKTALKKAKIYLKEQDFLGTRLLALFKSAT